LASQGDGHETGDVLAHVIRVLEEITGEWDVDEISGESRLATLNLESINLVYFIAELQHKYGLQQQLFTRIRSTGRSLGDLRVADIADFVHEIRRARGDQREERQS